MPEAMRLDMYLRNSGIIPRRSRAKEACDEGLVAVDGKTAKSSTQVSVGQVLRVSLSLQTREYEILDLPAVPAPRKLRDSYCRLLSQEHTRPDDW